MALAWSPLTLAVCSEVIPAATVDELLKPVKVASSSVISLTRESLALVKVVILPLLRLDF